MSKNMWWLIGIAATLYLLHNSRPQYVYTAGLVPQPAVNPNIIIQGLENL